MLLGIRGLADKIHHRNRGVVAAGATATDVRIVVAVLAIDDDEL